MTTPTQADRERAADIIDCLDCYHPDGRLISSATLDRIAQALADERERCGACDDSVVQEARDLLLSRAKRGIAKYGVTLDRGDLSTIEWMTHAIEEQADSLVYMLRIRRDLVAAAAIRSGATL